MRGRMEEAVAQARENGRSSGASKREWKKQWCKQERDRMQAASHLALFSSVSTTRRYEAIDPLIICS